MSVACKNCELAWRMLGMTAEERLAIVLARLARPDGGVPTHSVGKLAKLAGLARETASRIMGEWETKKWIERKHGGVGLVLKKTLLELAQALQDGRA